jgi:hypothetical protein
MFVRASGWAESWGGARRRVLWVVVVALVLAALGISKSEVLSIVKEGAIIAVFVGAGGM